MVAKKKPAPKPKATPKPAKTKVTVAEPTAGSRRGPAVEIIPEPIPIEEQSFPIEVEPPVALESPASLFEDLESHERQVELREDGLPALDSDLTPDEKSEFIKMLNAELPLVVRARQLAKLAQYTDTKRAAVALRAIQEINSVTGVSHDRPTESTPMFILPADAKVSVNVTKVLK